MLTLHHLPQPGFLLRLEKSIASGAFWQVAIPVILGAVLASLLLLGAFRPSAKSSVARESGGLGTDSGTAGRDELIREVAGLDERNHRGELADSQYRNLREGLKSRILDTSEPPSGAEHESATGSVGADGE